MPVRDYAADKGKQMFRIKLYLRFIFGQLIYIFLIQTEAIKRFLTDFYTDLPDDGTANSGGKAFKYSKQLVNIFFIIIKAKAYKLQEKLNKMLI